MQLWLAWRYLKSGSKFLNLTSGLAILGMIIGVASLVVSMAVVSGYESTLKKAVIDVVGDLVVVKRGKTIAGNVEVEKEIKPLIEGYVAYTPFVVVEAVLAHHKKISGVIIEGADPQTLNKVLNLEPRLKEGSFELGYRDDVPEAMIGQGIAKKFALKVGDNFRVVMPQATGFDKERFRPRPQKFVISGILNLGRYDYDNRFILTNISAAQDFAEIGDRITGVRIRVAHPNQAIIAENNIKSDADSPYWARSWFSSSRNLFDAIKYEKLVIFLVIMLIIFAASFNISSTLFVSVMKRYGDISILKTLGANRKFFVQLFAAQGLFIGAIGSILGVALGLLACFAVVWIQEKYGILPASVYKIHQIDLEIRWQDLLTILLCSMFMCFLATIAPARRGARFNPVDGLRYE